MHPHSVFEQLHGELMYVTLCLLRETVCLSRSVIQSRAAEKLKQPPPLSSSLHRPKEAPSPALMLASRAPISFRPWSVLSLRPDRVRVLSAARFLGVSEDRRDLGLVKVVAHTFHPLLCEASPQIYDISAGADNLPCTLFKISNSDETVCVTGKIRIV